MCHLIGQLLLGLPGLVEDVPSRLVGIGRIMSSEPRYCELGLVLGLVFQIHHVTNRDLRAVGDNFTRTPNLDQVHAKVQIAQSTIGPSNGILLSRFPYLSSLRLCSSCRKGLIGRVSSFVISASELGSGSVKVDGRCGRIQWAEFGDAALGNLGASAVDRGAPQGCACR